MVNPFKETNWKPDAVALRSFARSLIIGFPCLALALLLIGYAVGDGWKIPFSLKVGGLGVAAGLLFLTVPVLARPFYLAWYALACGMGLVVGNVLLAVVYYVFFTGIGLVRRVAPSRPIRKHIDKTVETYWQDAEPPREPKRYYNQF